MFVGEIALNTAVKVKEISTSIFLRITKGFSKVHFFRRSRKLFLISLVSWLIVVAAGYAVYRYEVQNEKNSFYQQAVTTVNDLATKCGPFLLEEDILALNLQMKEIDGLNYFKYAAIIDHQGSVIAQLGTEVDQRTDIYALGLVFHELLSGKRVYRFNTDVEALHAIPNIVIDPIKKVAPHVPDEPNRIIMHCVERERKNRYQSAADLYTDLTAFQRHQNINFDASDMAEFMKLHFKREAG